jgi:hypothetical protein
MTVNYGTAQGTVTPKNADYTQPLQGQLCDCPFMAGLASITWVNKTYIQKIVSGPDAKNYYTITFWDYPGAVGGVSIETGASSNPVDANGNPVTAVAVTVTVNAITRLLDENSKTADANGYYGAGCTVAGELWPIIFEKAYAKFCLYKKNALTISDLQDGNVDPGAIYSLSKSDWGGNAVAGMMFMTGLPIYILPTTQGTYSDIGGAGCASGDLFFFLRYGFCSETMSTYGLNKTKYPMAAMTYPPDSPNGTLFGQSAIIPDHCYSIMGIYISSNGGQYVILRDPHGMQDPPQNAAYTTTPANDSIWKYSNVQFKIGNLTSFTQNYAKTKTSLDLSIPTDAVFGLAYSDFLKYFSSFGWVKGY